MSCSHLVTDKRHLLLTNSHQGFLSKYIATKEAKKQNRGSPYQHLSTILLRTSPTLQASVLKENPEMQETEPVKNGKLGERGKEEGFLNHSGEFVFNTQLEPIGIPQFHSPAGSPLKSLQVTLTPSAMKTSPQIPPKAYSSVLKHPNENTQQTVIFVFFMKCHATLVIFSTAAVPSIREDKEPWTTCKTFPHTPQILMYTVSRTISGGF
ncbi:Mitogen-activated protein kinase 6 [Plecturocebus cupreus]